MSKFNKLVHKNGNVQEFDFSTNGSVKVKVYDADGNIRDSGTLPEESAVLHVKGMLLKGYKLAE